MGFLLSTMFALLALTLVESYAASPLAPQVMYWNSVLPKASMPKSISELVKPDFVTLTRKGDSLSGEMLDIADENIVHHYPYSYVKVSPLYQKILERGLGGQRVFFLEEDIHARNTMKSRLAGDCTNATFLSRESADAIPFSSSKVPDILNKFSVDSVSPQADMIKETIDVCESPAARGEVTQCVTSLESMIDFATSNLGRNVEAISTEVEKGGTVIQDYTIIPGVKKLAGNELLVCHKMNYPPYAVFLCHGLKNLTAYTVPMEGANGTRAKALAVCHEDTSDWNPEHYAMRELQIKPGTYPVCHFLKDLHVVWIPNQKPT